MAVLKKPRELPGLLLCGNKLPWVSQLKHLGNHISNVMDGNQTDIKVKAAKYVDKNNSLCQEFFYAHPKAMVKLNSIYNSHYTGSQLWKFGSPELVKFEATYNRSIKIMFNIPWSTHRFFIEPLSGIPHVSKVLVKRYLKFIENIKNSSKVALKQFLGTVQKDTRLTTGFNLRFIMTISGLNKIEDLKYGRVDFDYHTVEEKDAWKIQFAKELVDVRHGELIVPGLGQDEIQTILDYICSG